MANQSDWNARESEFQRKEQAILTALKTHFGTDSQVGVRINRESGKTWVTVDGRFLSQAEVGELLRRVAALAAKKIMLQNVRDANGDA